MQSMPVKKVMRMEVAVCLTVVAMEVLVDEIDFEQEGFVRAITIVYSHMEEARESRRHIDFLQAQGYLTGDLVSLDLEDLPGVQGLRALRVGINLDSQVLAQRAERLAS